MLEELRRNPNRWARVKRWEKRTSASSAAQRIRKGEQAGIDPKEFESRGAILDGGKASALYLRFVGSP